MATDACTIALCELPKSLMRTDLERRLPTGTRFIDLTGKWFNGNCVKGFAGFLKQYSVWLCKCKCGCDYIARTNFINQRGGGCGCGNRTHGLSQTPEYDTWRSMRGRCYNERDPAFKHYGGRGIRVCDRWLESFDNFYKDMGARPSEKHSIDRIDNDRDYEKQNCRWATKKQQVWNSRNTRFIECDGVRKPVSAWAEEVGVTRERMRQRVNRCVELGADLSEAVTTVAGSEMPCVTRSKSKRKEIVSAERKFIFRPELFDGEVHHLTDADISPLTFDCFTFNARGLANSKMQLANIRRLGNHILFQATQRNGKH